MNLPVEYLTRDKRCHNLLSLPCSLFLTKDDYKLVITICHSFGNIGLVIKHWKLSETKDTERLPPFVEFKIRDDELFDSKFVVLEGYKTINYIDFPFESGLRQFADPPHCHIQDKEYSSCLDSYYNNSSHKVKRMAWLWDAFDKVYNVGIFHKDLPKQVLGTWLYWKKYLLLETLGTAPELVFRCEYPHPELKIISWPFYSI